MCGFTKFGTGGKLQYHFISPFKVIKRVGRVEYHLALPPKLARVHNIFHISPLWWYVHNDSYIIQLEPYFHKKTWGMKSHLSVFCNGIFDSFATNLVPLSEYFKKIN